MQWNTVERAIKTETNTKTEEKGLGKLGWLTLTSLPREGDPAGTCMKKAKENWTGEQCREIEENLRKNNSKRAINSWETWPLWSEGKHGKASHSQAWKTDSSWIVEHEINDEHVIVTTVTYLSLACPILMSIYTDHWLSHTLETVGN